MASYYHFNTHQQHPTPSTASAVSHNHHGGRNRRGPRLSVSQNSQHKQFRGVRSMKELSESQSVSSFRSKYELGRSFDLEDDLEFCPGLVTESDLAYSGSERSSLASNSPTGSPTQQPQQVAASYTLNSSSPAFLPPSFQAHHSHPKLHQPSATRARNAIPIINPANGQGLTMPSPPSSVSPSRRGDVVPAVVIDTADASWRAPTFNKQASDLDFAHGEARHAFWSTGLSTNRLLGPRPHHIVQRHFFDMHLRPEVGVDSPRGATRKLIDTNLSVLLLLVLQLERFGASTSEDGGCFDFRMGVQFFPDLHTRRHNHLHRCLTTEQKIFSTHRTKSLSGVAANLKQRSSLHTVGGFDAFWAYGNKDLEGIRRLAKTMWIYVLLRCESYLQRWATGGTANGQRSWLTHYFGSYISF
ncbi:hypothetical protein FJTKL_05130 [Diaporthe vaccinii]|uniref:Uncharacterized protein n=1 Tax=Diaporthe vaccinii TaxID=105482 RepID=A0ABR4FEN4_9PEZI